MRSLREKLRGAVVQGTALAVATAVAAGACGKDESAEDATKEPFETGGVGGESSNGQGGISTGGRDATGGRGDAGESSTGGRASTGGGSTGGSATGGQSGGAGQGGATISQGGVASAWSGEEYSLELIGCGGENGGGFGFHGQCCYTALCYESVECLPADSLELPQKLQGFPPGSGRCTCSLDGREIVSGPFSPNPEDPKVPSSGNCCYVVGGIGCDGRPLMIDGMARVAPVVVRSDWGVAGLVNSQSAVPC
jgi:hypothetical protein